MITKRIASIKVVDAGSNPDVDSDFNTEIRERVLAHVAELHGKDNVSNIITFGSLAAKSAFKRMCTIYQIPYAQANKITGMIPPPVEGANITLNNLFDPSHERYNEGADFRSATSGSEWKKVIDGAKAIEGRFSSTGVHPCGVLISSKPLTEAIPLQRSKEGHSVSQWTYPECESMGLIKFDFLGLDAVDLVQHTIEYIVKMGKPAPNMLELIHGDMDDKKTYELFSRGETVGVFQFGSSMVQDFCKKMKPSEFEDIAASTALLRPGPMGMLSHVRYAARKNGQEEVESIHPEFAGSDLDEILAKTYGLVVYQESILKIANQIAGMTLQEGDELRKAMGKKKMKVMLAMKPKFMEGGRANGFSDEALNTLWDTIGEFAKYGFNKSHSIAYAQNAYQTAYLKANYPVEFMAALISQNIGVKEKILMFLQEARKMGLKIGSVDINLSDVSVAPNFTKEGQFDIVYGISGVNAVSEDMAKIIVKEREANGKFKNIQDVINRCSPLGVSNKRIYENLTYAGAFDSFGVTRQGVIKNLPGMLGDSKISTKKGASLFDMMGGDDNNFDTVDMTDEPEYDFVEKLKKEAEVIGLYLTAHPLMNVGRGLSQGKITPVNKLMQAKRITDATIVGSITEIEKKLMRKGKSITVNIDDGSGYIKAVLGRGVVKGIDKMIAQERIEKLYVSGDNELPSDVEALACNREFEAIPDVEPNSVYVMDITFRPSFDESSPYGARINKIRPLALSHEGMLPIRIRVNPQTVGGKTSEMKERIMKFAEAVSKKFPGDYPIHASVFTNKDMNIVDNDSKYFKALCDGVKNFTPDTKVAGKTPTAGSNLFGGESTVVAKKGKAKAKVEGNVRELPAMSESLITRTKVSEQEIAEILEYFDTGFTAAKNAKLEEILSNKFGAERVDFGIFNSTMIED